MASGSVWVAKSDVISSLFQIECKTKEKPGKTISVKREWLDKIEDEAFEAGKTAATVISFGTRTDYFILRDRDFLGLIEELIQLRKEMNDIEDERIGR